METLLFIVIILLAAYVVYTKFFEKKREGVSADSCEEPKQEQQYPYERKNLLTKTEYTFFKALKLFCDENQLLFCPKVRMEDFISVTDKQNNAKYRGYIKSRHIDFMLCDEQLHILCGIELDDKSHNTQKAQKTDDFKNKVFAQINIPLFRISTTSNYREDLWKIYKNLFPEKSQDDIK